MNPLDLDQLEQAARLLIVARQNGDRGEFSANDGERQAEALSLLLAVLNRNGVEL